MIRPLLALALLLPAAAAPVQVGLLPAKITPAQATTIMAEPGTLSDWVAETAHVERGAVIACLNKERTEQEREEMELKIAREKVQQRDELRKLELQRRKVQFYLGLSEGERRYAGDMQQDDLPPTQESLRDIDERIALLKREMESAPRLKHNEFERAHAKNTIRMPFSGRLQYNCPLPAAEEGATFDYIPTPGLPFASVCDDSAFFISVSIARAELTQLDPAAFSVSIALPGGKNLTGSFSHRRVEQAGNSDMLVYFFRVPQEEHETAFNMLGSNAQAKLVYEAEGETQVLPKLELISRPETAGCENWEQVVERLYPGSAIILIGERDIILRRN